MNMSNHQHNTVLTYCQINLYLKLSFTNFDVVPYSDSDSDSDSGTWQIVYQAVFSSTVTGHST
jgi:hypothetical protein